MKILFILFFVFLSSNSVFALNKDNWRCWPNDGIEGVVKVDLENKVVCSTGYDGKNYECKDNSRVLNIDSIQNKTLVIAGKEMPAVVYTASSNDGQIKMTLALFQEEFQRPRFPQFKVSPANFEINSGIFGYPSFIYSKVPDGNFGASDFYCLSEKYL